MELPPGLPLDVLGHAYESHGLALEPGDRLLIVTDGFIERNAKVVLSEILVASADRHPREVVRELAGHLIAATGGDLRDDATVSASTGTGPVALATPPQAPAWNVRHPTDAPVGCRVLTIVPPSLREAHVAGFSRHLSTGEARILGVPVTLPVLHKDGSEAHCRLLVERAPTGSGRALYIASLEPLDHADP